jgi:hypothetical protein
VNTAVRWWPPKNTQTIVAGEILCPVTLQLCDGMTHWVAHVFVDADAGANRPCVESTAHGIVYSVGFLTMTVSS